MMMGGLVGWSLPGEDGAHLWGAPVPPWDGPLLGRYAGVSAGEDPVAPAAGIWVWPRAPGEDSVGLGERSEKPPQGFPGGHTSWQRQNLPAKHPPAQPPQKEHPSGWWMQADVVKY